MKPRFELPNGFIIEKEDALNWVLKEYRIRERGNKKGEKYLADHTYHATIDKAFQSAVHRIPLTANTKQELREILNQLERISENLSNIN